MECESLLAFYFFTPRAQDTLTDRKESLFFRSVVKNYAFVRLFSHSPPPCHVRCATKEKKKGTLNFNRSYPYDNLEHILDP